MLSLSSTSKQGAFLVRKSLNLCEETAEYPTVRRASIPRHVSTDGNTIKIPQGHTFNKLSDPITTEHRHHQRNDTKTQSQAEKDETEIIELFPSRQKENNDEKLYKKRRYRKTTTPDQPPTDESRDATD